MALFEKAEIERIIQGVVDTFLIPRFRELGMNATGQWLDSLEVKSEVDENFGIGVIRGAKYSEQLAYGRRPNKNQSHDELRRWAYGMANFNPEFMAWLQVRGLTEYGVEVAYTIAKNGTTWYQKGGTDLIEILQSQEVIDYINSEISNYLRAGAEAEIVRITKETLEA